MTLLLVIYFALASLCVAWATHEGLLLFRPRMSNTPRMLWSAAAAALAAVLLSRILHQLMDLREEGPSEGITMGLGIGLCVVFVVGLLAVVRSAFRMGRVPAGSPHKGMFTFAALVLLVFALAIAMGLATWIKLVF